VAEEEEVVGEADVVFASVVVVVVERSRENWF